MSNDTIKRSDAIKAAEDGMCTFYDCDVLDRLNAAPSADRPQGWIPCSEREPSESGTYLVTTRWKGEYSGNIYNDVGVADYERGKWEIATGLATAWMPLPEPYERKESE